MSHPAITRYFEAFNRGDIPGMVAELTPDIAHHVNEGDVRIGTEAFAAFCAHMNRCYKERLTEMVIFAQEDRGAAEYMVNGTYLATDDGCPEARGQTYRLPAGSFFTLRDGKIARVTTYYNKSDWIAQVA